MSDCSGIKKTGRFYASLATVKKPLKANDDFCREKIYRFFQSVNVKAPSEPLAALDP